MRGFLTSLLEVAEIALITIGAVFLIRTFLIQPFLVSGGSMQPLFDNGDYVLVDQLTYHFREPDRGDVMVFHSTGKTYFIKRAIGLPGDRLSIHDGVVTIRNDQYPNGHVLNEAYLAPGAQTSGDVDITLGPDEYFVLGDNRSYSYDSRSWGVLKRDEIVGVVRIRLWPLIHIRTFPVPQY